MPLKLSNNAVSRLAASLTTSATTLSVMPGDGAKFPALTAGDWFPLTIVKSDGALEIVKCTARSTDTFTVTRAQEGTAALAFSAGDRVELRLTAAAVNEVNQTAINALAGNIQTATNAETQAGTVNNKAVTPESLASRTATELRTGMVELATQGEAEAGTDNARVPTVLRVMQLLRAAAANATTALRGTVLLASNTEAQAGSDATKAITPAALAARTATESRTGLLEIATQAEVNAGTDDERAVTPKKLRAGFTIVKSGGLFGIAFPSWLGGFIINAGKTDVPANDSPVTVSLPIAYATQHTAAVACVNYGAIIPNGMIGAVAYSNSLTEVIVMADASHQSMGITNISWISIGY